jgi:hypothetical protein
MYQATVVNLLSKSGFAQSRRLRMASSTSASASLACRASASATSARSSTAVSLSFWASIHDRACSSALHAYCSLCSAVMMSSRCACSAASARTSASRNLSKRCCKAIGRGLRSREHALPYCGRQRPLDKPYRGLLLPCRVPTLGKSSGRSRPLQLTLWNYAAPWGSSPSRTHTRAAS